MMSTDNDPASIKALVKSGMESIPEFSPEFSYEIKLDALPSTGRVFKLTATVHERQALIKRLDLLQFNEFRAEIKVKPRKEKPKKAKSSGQSSIIRVEGRIFARLTQPCVVSLEPVFAIIEEIFDLDFVPETDADMLAREFVLSEANDHEPLEGSVLDLAEVATQQLLLALDPYPRSNEADLYKLQKDAEAAGCKFEVNGEKSSPFAVLSGLKNQKN